MKPSLNFAVITIAMFAVSGCTSTLEDVGVQIRTSDTTYKVPASAAITNDIKGILMAGGLDTALPSAPTNNSKMTQSSNDAKAMKDAEKLVAKLEKTSIISNTQIAQNNPIEASRAAIVQKPNPDPVRDIALALAPSNNKSSTAQAETEVKPIQHPLNTQVVSLEPEVVTTTVVYPDIGIPALETAEVKKKPATKPKQVSVTSKSPKVDRVAPLDERQLKQKPKRF